MKLLLQYWFPHNHRNQHSLYLDIHLNHPASVNVLYITIGNNEFWNMQKKASFIKNKISSSQKENKILFKEASVKGQWGTLEIYCFNELFSLFGISSVSSLIFSYSFFFMQIIILFMIRKQINWHGKELGNL